MFGGWHEDQFADQTGGFSREELDAAAPQNPVFIQKSYSQTYMNSLAAKELSAGGVSTKKSTKGSKAGGGGGGDARGLINQAARHVPRRSPTERISDIAEYNTVLNRMGLTTVYDIGRENDGDFSPIETLADKGELTVRVFHSLRYRADSPQDVNAAVSLIQKSRPKTSSDWFGLIGIGEHTYNPIHDTNLRSSSFSDGDWELFEKLATAAAAGGWPIHEHAMQDATAQRFLDICERLSAAYPVRDLRWTLAHCDLLGAESIDRARRLGVVLAIHNKTAKPVAEPDSPPLAKIQLSGIVWGLGSDATVVAPTNPFTALWWVVTGKVFPDRVALRQPITRAEALIAHTRSNAYLLFKEKDLGSIEVGKLADLVVLDRDYLTISADAIRELHAVQTYVAGRCVYDAAK